MSILISSGVRLTPGSGGERWDVIDAADERDGKCNGDIGVSEFDAHSDFPNALLEAVVRTLQDDEQLDEGLFYSITVKINDRRSVLGEASSHFSSSDLATAI